MSQVYDVGSFVTVRIQVNDESAITRCVENHDEEGRSQPDERGSGGWRNVYYGSLTTRDAVLQHFLWNAVANGVSDVSNLDGWADLPHGAVTMDVTDADLDFVDVRPEAEAVSS